MRFEGAYYTNLCFRKDRDYFMRRSLACQDFPPDKIFRIEGVDNRRFADKAAAVEVLSRTYPEIGQCLSVGWMGKGDVCCVAAWKNAVNRIYTDLTDEGIALYVLDDKLVRNLFWFFEDLISSFNNEVDIVQLFGWESEQFPRRVESPLDSEIHPSLYEGVIYAGDAGLLLSKGGAKTILDVYQDHSSCFPETLFYTQPDGFNNFYTVKDFYKWIGHCAMPGDLSDRELANGRKKL